MPNIDNSRKIYEAYQTIEKYGRITSGELKRFANIRNIIISQKLKYLKEQPHLKDCKITFLKIHGHPVFRIDRPTDYDYSFAFESEIFEDDKWIGHCNSCLKPLFVGDKGSKYNQRESQTNMSWRGCEECSQRNGNKIETLSK